MTIKMILAALVAFSLSGAALAAEGWDSSLQLSGPAAFGGPAAPKLSFDAPPTAPAAMEKAIGSEVSDSLAYEATSFSKDLEAMVVADRGDGDRGGYVLVEVLAFILGVIPGFGIGHLVGGSIMGFVTWLCVDIVIGVLLFWVFPILLFPAFGYMYTVSTILVVVERIFEGYSAFRAAYWNYGSGQMSDSNLPRDDRMVINAAPNLATLHF